MNLDLECAELGQDIAKDGVDENAIRNALGVLQEHGIYAFFLYCGAKGEPKISDKSMCFLKSRRLLPADTETSNLFERLREAFSTDLQKLLFAKELLERALVYGRYHAKGKG
jgi:hypothetical protein